MITDAHHLAPFIRRDWLMMGSGQQLHLAQYGNPQGIPLLYLHGGPGAGTSVSELSLFNPEHYWILLLDQRGAGQSRPSGELEHNHLNGLICDIEAIRIHLGIARWCLAGGSFGATLAIIYSGLFPHRVIAQVLWALFIPSTEGIEWLYAPSGAAQLYPQAYREFVAPSNGLANLFTQYQLGFNAQDEATRHEFARRWLQWELTLAGAPIALPRRLSAQQLALAQIELHYAQNGYFNMFSVLQRVTSQVTARTLLLQGTQDAVCPARLLATFLTKVSNHRIEIHSIVDGGHSLNSEILSLAVTLEIQAMWAWIKRQELT
ncbi:alpha/beta fold hydrolase [Shewanella xiamenensis]|uniref:alpha/beta fold hydrolase n=1 Tax=Shewanella xiamenensis TaxID=332186 RepID=UPI00214FC1EE|nr:alpha/beta fold hydrolase [Shewanella xiamenensis]MCR4534654.1 alpha/beta fold hydrolase [Shewanella xiamenensis]